MQTAVVFPGQGAQFVGMGKAFFNFDPLAKEVLRECSEGSGFDLERIILQGPEKALMKTTVAQPAIFAVSLAIYKSLSNSLDFEPNYVAGFSLGQYSALCASEVFDVRKGAELLKLRGQYMQETKEGRMAAIIGMDLGLIKETLLGIEEYVDVANLNCPGQTVISGTKAGIVEAVEILKHKGAKRAIPLKVSGAFHSKLMEEAAKKFQRVLDKESFAKPKFPVIANETAEEISDVKASLYNQLTSPVLWQDSIYYLRSKGVTRFIEVGPGKVLSGLIKKIDGSLEVINIEEPSDMEKLR